MQFRFESFPWFESLNLNSWFKSQKQKYLNHNSWFKSHFPPGTGTSRRVGARGCTIWRDFHTSPCLWSTHKSLVWIWASMASFARSFPPARPCTARRERCYPMSKVSPASQWRLNLRLWHVSQLQEAKMRSPSRLLNISPTAKKIENHEKNRSSETERAPEVASFFKKDTVKINVELPNGRSPVRAHAMPCHAMPWHVHA